MEKEIKPSLCEVSHKMIVRMSTSVPTEKSKWIKFPEVPEGYNPKGTTREIIPDFKEAQVYVIDGFQIKNEADKDDSK